MSKRPHFVVVDFALSAIGVSQKVTVTMPERGFKLQKMSVHLYNGTDAIVESNQERDRVLVQIKDWEGGELYNHNAMDVFALASISEDNLLWQGYDFPPRHKMEFTFERASTVTHADGTYTGQLILHGTFN